MIKELYTMIINSLCLFFVIFTISAVLTTPVAVLFVVANYLDGNL